jgi:hypothetical protein
MPVFSLTLDWPVHSLYACRVIAHAHQTADEVDRALQSSNGMYHFLPTPNATATRGYLALRAMLTRRASAGSVCPFCSSVGVVAGGVTVRLRMLSSYGGAGSGPGFASGTQELRLWRRIALADVYRSQLPLTRLIRIFLTNLNVVEEERQVQKRKSSPP